MAADEDKTLYATALCLRKQIAGTFKCGFSVGIICFSRCVCIACRMDDGIHIAGNTGKG